MSDTSTTAAAVPLWVAPNPTDPDIHLESSGTLPPGRLETGDDYEQPAPSSVEPNLVAYDPATGDTEPRWVAASSLFSAADSVPVGTLTSAVTSSYAGNFDSLPSWQPLRDEDNNELVLAIAGGAGKVLVSATVPLSANGGGLYLREVEVRLVADGWTSAVQTPTFAADSSTGATNVVNFAETELYLPPLRVHSVRPEVRAINGGALAIYSTGTTITIIESPDNWGGAGNIRAEQMATALVPVATTDGHMIITNEGGPVLTVIEL